MDDAMVVEASRKGDFGAFESLVRKYQEVMFDLAAARVGDRGIAEEAAQDAFVLAHGKLNQLRDASRFGAWLRAIVLRQCAIQRRRRGRNPLPRPLRGDETDDVRSPITRPEDHDGGAVLGIPCMIGDLPRGLRAAAVLCLQDGLSPSAAAGVLGIKPGALRKRLHDARARLQLGIVEKARRDSRLDRLPRDFAERCVCRCRMAQEARDAGKEVISMRRRNCGCGCQAGRRLKGSTRKGARRKK